MSARNTAPAAGRRRPQTALVAAGSTSGAGQPLNVPLVLASTFRAASGYATSSRWAAGSGREYSRDDGTPTWQALEEVLG